MRQLMAARRFPRDAGPSKKSLDRRAMRDLIVVVGIAIAVVIGGAVVLYFLSGLVQAILR
jgi:hypothetical protein